MKTLQPHWPAPSCVKACTTLRSNDMQEETHRLLLKKILPSDPCWIRQTHSTIALPAHPDNKNKEADATFTDQINQVCVVLTADCLPILLCHQKGTHVAAIHAGWRGLSQGIIETTLNALKLPPEELLVWLGPAIGPQHFEVGDEVRDIFLKFDPTAVIAFSPSPNQRWLADLYTLARLRLKNQGINAIYGGEHCTYSEQTHFFSYRREGLTGRMASLIWLTDAP